MNNATAALATEKGITPERYIEIDLLRSLAIAMMIAYHTLFDLDYYYGWPVLRSLGEGGWLLARTTATLFLLLVGVSFVISWSRRETLHRSVSTKATDVETPRWGVSNTNKKYLRRIAMLFASALLVSIATFIVDPETYVRFGILHLIAIATLILPLAAPLKEWNALLGLLVLTTAELLPASAQTTLLIPLGIPPDNFATVDYFPFLPWFGVILIGYAIGYFLYIRNLRWRKPEAFSILNSPAFAQPSLKLWPASKATAGRQFSILARWPGRHSLLLYLVHQPIILSVLHLIFGKPDL